jgi:hypothetical protein
MPKPGLRLGRAGSQQQSPETRQRRTLRQFAQIPGDAVYKKRAKVRDEMFGSSNRIRTNNPFVNSQSEMPREGVAF